MNWTLLQAACVAIVCVYVGVRARQERTPGRFLLRYGLLAAAAWLGEDTCIRAYGFYEYSPGWSLRLDRVPVLVACIWPAVILSARDLARDLLPGRSRAVPLVAAGIVLADAALIEPIAVHAGLWSWSVPGLFGVPPVGVYGWACFAGVSAAVLDVEERGTGFFARPWLVAQLLAGVAHLHLMLLAAWWAALRWCSGPVAPWPAVVIVWVVSLGWLAVVLHGGHGRRVHRGRLLLRLPGALLFFALLFGGGPVPADVPLTLEVYALAFVPPYLGLLVVRRTVFPVSYTVGP